MYTEDPLSLGVCVGAVTVLDILFLCWVCEREREKERERVPV